MHLHNLMVPSVSNWYKRLALSINVPVLKYLTFRHARHAINSLPFIVDLPADFKVFRQLQIHINDKLNRAE